MEPVAVNYLRCFRKVLHTFLCQTLIVCDVNPAISGRYSFAWAIVASACLVRHSRRRLWWGGEIRRCLVSLRTPNPFESDWKSLAAAVHWDRAQTENRHVRIPSLDLDADARIDVGFRSNRISSLPSVLGESPICQAGKTLWVILQSAGATDCCSPAPTPISRDTLQSTKVLCATRALRTGE